MAKMVDRVCDCGTPFQTKASNAKRGWGKSCSKSCAATKREKVTGNYIRHINEQDSKAFDSDNPDNLVLSPHHGQD